MADLPKTPAEKRLEELQQLKRRIFWDEISQKESARELEWGMQCGSDCPYPDKCIPMRQNWHGCLLNQITWVVDAPWWKRMLGQKYEPAETEALQRIRQSKYYNSSHEPILKRISLGR